MSDSWSLDPAPGDTSWQLDPVGPPKKLGAGIKVGGADIGAPLTEQLGLNGDSAALAAGSGRSHARLVAARKKRQDTAVANEASQQAQVDDLLRTDESYTPLGVAKAGAASIVRMAGSIPIGLQQGSEAANRMAHRFGDATIGKQFTDYWLAPADMVLGAAGDAPTKLQTNLNTRGDAIDVGQSERDTVPYIVSNAVGQITGLIALNAVGGGGAADTAMLAQGFNQVADAFKAKGVTGAKADAAILGGGTVMALLEKTGLESVLEGVPLAIKNRVIRGAVDVGIAGGYNALEEFVQQIAGNYAQKVGGIKDQDLMEGVGQSAIGGGGAGGIARAVLGKWGKHVVAPPLAPDAAPASAPDRTAPPAPVETHAPLTEGDITSPIATPIIQQGRDMLKKGMEELQGIAGV
ncbi:MAG: hypothetical protein H7345_06590, partial [Rubritepida sp.]|nr:hypothetical protein [Rubritepida sp.]